MLFIKYLSDLWKDRQDRQEQYRAHYQGDERRVERALSRECFIMPKVELSLRPSLPKLRLSWRGS